MNKLYWVVPKTFADLLKETVDVPAEVVCENELTSTPVRVFGRAAAFDGFVGTGSCCYLQFIWH